MICDQRVILNGFYSAKAYPEHLRRIRYKDPTSGKTLALRWLDPFLGGKDLPAITRVTLDKITDEKLARGCSNATVNRMLALVRAILRKCVNEWEWLDRAPQVRMLRVPTDAFACLRTKKHSGF